MKSLFVKTALLYGLGISLVAAGNLTIAGNPRIVNIYNFVRNSDCRVPNSEEVLFETTRKQIELIKPTGLSATWALQYDAFEVTEFFQAT